jgi:hypothetical protein
VSAGDLAAVVVTMCVIVAMTVLLFVLFQLLHVLRDLRQAAEHLTEEALPTIVDLRTTVDTADAELERLHGVIETAEHLSSGLASATRTASRVVATPAIKTKALAAGAGSAWRRVRRR